MSVKFDVMNEGLGDDGSLLYQYVRSKFLFNKHKSAFLQTTYLLHPSLCQTYVNEF